MSTDEDKPRESMEDVLSKMERDARDAMQEAARRLAGAAEAALQTYHFPPAVKGAKYGERERPNHQSQLRLLSHASAALGAAKDVLLVLREITGSHGPIPGQRKN